MKTSTLAGLPAARAPTGQPAPAPGAASVHGRLQRAVLRLWLRYRLDAYRRGLHAIAAQRENDFHAERLLHRAISRTRSQLHSL